MSKSMTVIFVWHSDVTQILLISHRAMLLDNTIFEMIKKCELTLITAKLI